MENDSNNPDTQGQPTGADGQGTSEGAIPKERFDQVWAKLKALEGEVTQRQAREEILLQTIAASANQTRAPQAAAEPEVDMDPEERRKFDAYVKPLTARYEAMIEQLDSRLAGTRFAQVSSGYDPQVVQLAQQLQANWRASGKTGWEPEDALVFAQGELYRQGKLNKADPKAQSNDFNQMGQRVLSSQGAPPSLAPQKKIPSNLDSLPYEQRMAILEKEIGDDPI